MKALRGETLEHLLARLHAGDKKTEQTYTRTRLLRFFCMFVMLSNMRTQRGTASRYQTGQRHGG